MGIMPPDKRIEIFAHGTPGRSSPTRDVHDLYVRRPFLTVGVDVLGDPSEISYKPSFRREAALAKRFCKAKASGLSRWPVVLGF